MQVNTKTLVSISEANKNFSKVARMVDEQGIAVIMKNNSPRYVLIDYNRFEGMENAENEKIEALAQRILTDNLAAFQELAK